MTDKKVFKFGNGTADGRREMKSLLGGKGANLAEMSAIGLPVPAGFTISTESCHFYGEHGGVWPDGLEEEVRAGVRHLEESLKEGFGDSANPLLVSVRSGAAVSMPGMMDTVLNLGMNDDVAAGLAKRHGGDERFAFDAYRRFIDMFGGVVMGVPHEKFEHAIERVKQESGVDSDVDLNAAQMKAVVDAYKKIYHDHQGESFPTDPWEQLRLSINAVFGSWNSARAIKYRRINHIRGLIGTAVNVQAMVFGDMGDTSGTGVCFTRNPSTGEEELYGEYLINAQGEDVVAGIRTPEDISRLKEEMPGPYDELLRWTRKLEEHYQDMQDIEFTIQEGTLYILQTRSGKRTGTAAVKIAVDMVAEGLVDKRRAVGKLVEPRHLDQLMHPQFKDPTSFKDKIIGQGLPASPGAAVGQVVFTADHAEEAKAVGKQVILVRIETSPDDVGGMDAAQGILTTRGGMTSHAAVVARGWGKPCVAGCGDIVVDYEAGEFRSGKVVVKEGDWIAVDGSTGQVVLGRQELEPPKMGGNFETFMSWVSDFQTMNVRTNADTPPDAARARELGAVGIGLTRTEHMFFEGDRISKMREMIMASTEAERRAALAKLLPFQKEDFIGIFRAMDGYPVTIRLLDPPLHEFLPHEEADQAAMAKSMGLTTAAVKAKVDALDELNPMLGHRGCRLGVTYPEITEMQARAILEAAVELSAEGVTVLPEIMVPLIGTVEEYTDQRDVIKATAEKVFAEKNRRVEYMIGTMIEIPRAALTADEIAKEAEFFSFGTNDLTQMTFGYSRDDAGKFLPQYVDRKILPYDPFQTIDFEGVGKLVKTGTSLGRSVRKDLKVGICGEHGGDPASVRFCYHVGMNYVSCSPFRVPIARLAAAQAALEEEDVKAEKGAVMA
ncbi:MAG: pyruvate, phosphate dikinase [Rhodothermales bacterium]|nr:pyruvate, phosphate dikinase [Rhodothermales bacterium]